jgi:hypothetical protein
VFGNKRCWSFRLTCTGRCLKRSLRHRKETTMHYKSFVHELLKQRPEMHEQLCRSRKLLATLNLYASQLKTSHEAWKDRLTQRKPGHGECQIASEALEIALKELENCLPSRVPPQGSEPLSLDEAIAYVRGRMPPE